MKMTKKLYVTIVILIFALAPGRASEIAQGVIYEYNSQQPTKKNYEFFLRHTSSSFIFIVD